MSDTFFSVGHETYGKGTAILVKHRHKRCDDLFMCSFKGLKNSRTFYCRKHFDLGEEVWWDDGKPRKIVSKRSKESELEEALRGFFFGGQPANT